MELLDIVQKLGIALGLGLLVGLQRERTASRVAGFRTFPLITVLGSIAALLALEWDGWIIGFGFVGLAIIIWVGNLAEIKSGQSDPGLTTEAAMLVMYAIGAYLIVGETAVAIVVGGVVAVLLHLKPQLHEFAGRIGDRDFRAVMQFVLITLVVLPVLPNEFYGPYEVLNPFRIWLMVVLIVGISLGGYLGYKLLGEKAGSILGGVLGGFISSTATTVSYARRSRRGPAIADVASFVIMIASAIVFLRVLILIGATAPHLLATATGPLATLLLIMSALAVWSWVAHRQQKVEMPEHENPSEMKMALLFAALYAVILLAVAAGKEHFGEAGLYAVAILSGLTDMDAITLSMTQLVNSQVVPEDTAWRLILAAGLSNLVFKASIVALLGDRQLLRRIAVLFGISFAAGLLICLLWPGR